MKHLELEARIREQLQRPRTVAEVARHLHEDFDRVHRVVRRLRRNGDVVASFHNTSTKHGLVVLRASPRARERGDGRGPEWARPGGWR